MHLAEGSPWNVACESRIASDRDALVQGAGFKKGFNALFCRKSKIPFGRLFWAIQFGFRGPARRISDFWPVTPTFAL